MSIADTNLDIEQLAEECQRELNRRYAFYRMLAATDRVLWRLEELNLGDVREMPAGLGKRIRESLSELPESALAKLRDGTVQQAMDGTYDAQEALLRLRDPDREIDDEEVDAAPPEPKAAPVPAPDAKARFRARVLRILCAAPQGAAWSGLVQGASPEVRERHRGWLDEMEAGGLVRWDVPARGGGRRYFAVGEGSGGD